MKKKTKITLYVLSSILIAAIITSVILFYPKPVQEEQITLSRLSETSTSGNTFIIEIQGDFAYTLNLDNAYFKAINISDPYSPQIVGSLALNGTTHDMQIVGDRAYIASRYAGLHIVNIEDPENPAEVGFFSLESIEAILIRDSIAYIGSHTEYLQILNISDDVNPIKISIPTVFEHDIHGIGYVDDFLLATGSDGLFVFNITNSTNPILISQFSSIGAFSQFVLNGDYMYVPQWNQGLRVLNISDLENVHEITSSFNTTTPVDVQFIGNYAFVTAANDGILVFNIHQPDQLILKEVFTDSEKKFFTLVIRDDFLYVATGTDGLEIYQITFDKE